MAGAAQGGGGRPRRLGRRGGAVALGCAVLVALVGGLLYANFRSATRVRQQVLVQHQQAFHLHAMALANLLGSAEEELRYVAESSEVAAYYENRDLGMSMQYGLGLSLVPIRQRLAGLVELAPDHAPRFARLELRDADGTLLALAVSTAFVGDAPDEPPAQERPDRADGATRLWLSRDGRFVVASRAHHFKGRPAGQLVGWLRPDRVAAALAGDRQGPEPSSRLVILDAAGRACQPAGAPLPAGLAWPEEGGALTEVQGDDGPLLLQRARVPGQPLSLVDVTRRADVLGPGSPLGAALALSLTALLVLGSAGLAVHLGAKSLALQIRLDESQRREAEVAEKHAALSRVERERRRLWLAVNQSPATVLIADRSGRVDYVNPTFERVTGHAAGEVLGDARLLAASRALNGETHAAIWRKLMRGGTWQGEVENRRASGEPLWLSVSISPARDEGGEITHFIALGEDVTAQRLAAQELGRARDAAEAANRAKSAFLANMSHEIRTPLNAILGYSQLTSRDAALSPGSRQNLETINRAGEHLLALLNQVLEISKIEAGRATVERRAFDLGAVVADLQAMFTLRARHKGLSFEVAAGEGPRALAGDEAKIRQVLVNLLGNAVKFTERGGVRLAVEVVRTPGGLRLRAEVADTGPGIDPGEMDRLFREFEQTAAGRTARSGTGLGLAISRSYARLMGGDLTVASAPGRGATFALDLPVEASAEHAPARLGRRVLGLLGADHPPRALVVDDEPTHRGWLCETLRAVGFEVREAEDGAAAVAACAGGWPELVLMDLRMPGMDGQEAIRRIRQQAGGARLAIVVGSPGTELEFAL